MNIRRMAREIVCVKWILVAIVMQSSGIRAAEPDVDNRRAPLAINLSGVVDYSSEMPFVDVFKHARTWIPQAEGKPWGQGLPLELDEKGWVKWLAPGQYATTLMCVSDGHPPGRYICLYEGNGVLDFQGNARVINQVPGRIELEVSIQETMMLHLRATDPNNPVRNIRVIIPGFERSYEEQLFYPPFLKRTGQFRAIRFMDWMNTNNSQIQSWADRPKPDDFSQALKGVALEYMIDLCNRLNVDPWFCMPHLANEDYVRQFAEMVRDRLKPELKVYVEHSNEVWNRQFEQASYAARQGQVLSDNEYQGQLFHHARRSVEIFKTWEKVFGGTDRLVRVLGSQSANPWVSEQVLSFEDAYRYADALAIAPYFGNTLGSPETADQVARMSLDEMMAHCREEIRQNHDRIREHVKIAEAHGLVVIAYEGGQHLVGHGGAENHEELAMRFQDANRHPRMKDLYLEDLASWKTAGGQLFAVFSSVSRPSKWGSWGLLESERQDPYKAPKYHAIVEFLQYQPAWWD